MPRVAPPPTSRANTAPGLSQWKRRCLTFGVAWYSRATAVVTSVRRTGHLLISQSVAQLSGISSARSSARAIRPLTTSRLVTTASIPTRTAVSTYPNDVSSHRGRPSSTWYMRLSARVKAWT